MCFPLHLSKYLALSVLCEWIDVELLCRFDSAICNHVERSAYLNLIAAEHVKFQGYFEVAVFKSYLKWIVLRNLRVMNLKIKRKLLSNLKVKSLCCFAELRQLTIDSDVLVFREGFLELIRVCSKLDQLHISSGKMLDDAVVKSIGDTCKLLKVVSFPCWENENLEVTDASIVYLTEQCTLLETFYVANFEKLTDASVVALSRNCPDLRELTVSNLPLLTNTSLLSVAEYSSQLSLLEVRKCPGVTDVGLSAVITKCLELRYLTIDCTQMTKTKTQRQNPVAYYIFRGSSQILKLAHLVSLRLMALQSFSAEMLELITVTCKAMTVIMLTGILTLQAADFLCIPENCPHLTELSLVGCYNVPDAVVTAIAEKCVGLVLLDISGPHAYNQRRPTAVAITAIGKHCKRLHSLFLSNLRNVSWTETLIRDLLVGCPELCSLDLSYCTTIHSSEEDRKKGDLSKVITAGTSLRELHVQGNGWSMTEETIEKLKEVEGLKVFDK